jgi:hypothetical protein
MKLTPKKKSPLPLPKSASRFNQKTEKIDSIPVVFDLDDSDQEEKRSAEIVVEATNSLPVEAIVEIKEYTEDKSEIEVQSEVYSQSPPSESESQNQTSENIANNGLLSQTDSSSDTIEKEESCLPVVESPNIEDLVMTPEASPKESVPEVEVPKKRNRKKTQKYSPGEAEEAPLNPEILERIEKWRLKGNDLLDSLRSSQRYINFFFI